MLTVTHGSTKSAQKNRQKSVRHNATITATRNGVNIFTRQEKLKKRKETETEYRGKNKTSSETHRTAKAKKKKAKHRKHI